MASLKTQLVAVLDTVAAFVGFPAKYILGIASWAINKYVPDDETGFAVADGARAAPGEVHTILNDLFAKAITFIPSGLGRRMAEKAAALVLDGFVDSAWDALVGRLSRAGATPAGATTAAASTATSAATAFLEGA